MHHPAQASPFGCVLGLFGILCWILSGFFWRGFFLARNLEDPERVSHVRETMLIGGATTALLGLAFLVIGWRMAKASDMSRPRDPDKPKVRF